jgi:hypothetical protein
MWGAQAREAEYHAFRAAARRASGEEKTPAAIQKPAQVSLGAFTKNPPHNRNKGTKSWKPLVLEDTPEAPAGSQQDDGTQGTFSTPTRAQKIEHCNSLSAGSDPSYSAGTVLAPLASSNTLDSRTPSAPKAMTKASQTPSVMVNPTPKRVTAPTFIKPSQHSRASSVHSSPGYLVRSGGYPVHSPFSLRAARRNGLPARPMTASAQPPLVPFMQPPVAPWGGNVLVPDDISPSKQENKLASISSRHIGHPTVWLTPQGHFTPGAGLLTNANASYLPPPHFALNHNIRFQNVSTASPDAQQRAPLQYLNPEHAAEFEGSYSDPSSVGVPHFRSQNPYPTTAAARFHQNGPTEPVLGAIGPQLAQISLVYTSEEATYDRRTKMQKFVAAQQAMVKTGKTVLHNPDLHQVKANDGTSPAHSNNASMATTPERKPPSQFLIAGSLPVPTLATSEAPTHDPLALTETESKIKNDPCPLDSAALQKVFEVSNEDWLQLRPATPADRVRMNRVMRTFARAQAPEAHRGFVHETSKAAKRENLKQWMHLANKDNRPATAVRRLFEEAAAERLTKDVSGGICRDGALHAVLSDAEVQCASICAVGDIVANLMDGAGPQQSVIDAKGVFPQYKPAPEYAIERRQVLAAKFGKTSFFEDKSGGFFTAPSRIARDPRFRPAGKDAVPAKYEDSWKRWGDTFSGRRM